MFIISIRMSNPMTGDEEAATFRFDPDTLDQAKWNTAFPFIDAKLQALTTKSAAKELPVW